MHVSNDNIASKGLRGDSLTVPRCWPGTCCERTMPAGRLGDGKQRTSRSFRLGAILVLVSLVLVGCTSGPSKTASRGTSAAESGKSSASTPAPAATFIEPPGPVSAHPALLDEASAACRKAGASDITLCAGTVDAEVWGMPLVIVSNLRDQLACLLKVNVLDNATRLAGPDSASVAYPNDDTLYSTAFLDLRTGPQLLRGSLDERTLRRFPAARHVHQHDR
jgi:hypothetical protein